MRSVFFIAASLFFAQSALAAAVPRPIQDLAPWKRVENDRPGWKREEVGGADWKREEVGGADWKRGDAAVGQL
ncbi:hypothetical protein BOTBODRAFT_36113 [Botryobasidium botryosum FD-172 SS1]|uniref:Uncharacterized protein n=1 Tax=Botryobasidium botryosum (strain FD-172 SS1) TaxID=930990 RepID=A0A067M481_BOTB1|nr:hypothetical protein BOTBODRAFT_36113 [Botryobasidium botryosum FD-172 SS1]